METIRVQRLNGKAELHVTVSAPPASVKKVYKEEDLMRHKAYYESMIEKGQAGLARTNDLILKLQNG